MLLFLAQVSRQSLSYAQTLESLVATVISWLANKKPTILRMF